MTTTIVEPIVHELSNGHIVVYSDKEPLEGLARYAIQFTDNTDVFVVGNRTPVYTFIRFSGEGQLCVGRKKICHKDPKGIYFLGDLQIEWSVKRLLEKTDRRIDFEDHSYVEVASPNCWLAVMRGFGFLRLTRCSTSHLS